MISSIGDKTTSSITFWGCDETNTGGVLGVRINGQDFVGDTLLESEHYTGTVTATGLPLGDLEYQLLLDGQPATPVFKTKVHPAAGEPVSFIITGDALLPNPNGWARLAHEESDADVFACSEAKYMNPQIHGLTPCDAIAKSLGGVSISDLETEWGTLDVVTPGVAHHAYPGDATDEEAYQEFLSIYREIHRCSVQNEFERRFFYSNGPSIYQTWSNHEHTSGAGDKVPAPGEVQFEAALKAYREYYGKLNPPPPTGDVDSTPAPPLYFDKVVGDIHFVMLDYIPYTEAFPGGNVPIHYNNQARAGEAKQLDWAKQVIENTSSKFLILYSPSAAVYGGDPTALEWVNTTNGLLTSLNNCPATPILCEADAHQGFARFNNHLSAAGKGCMHFGVSAFQQISGGNTPVPQGTSDLYYLSPPFSQDWKTLILDDYRNFFQAYVYYLTAKVIGDRMHLALKQSFSGRVVWSGYVDAGGRKATITSIARSMAAV